MCPPGSVCTCGADRRSPCPIVIIDDHDEGTGTYQGTLGVPVSPVLGTFDDGAGRFDFRRSGAGTGFDFGSDRVPASGIRLFRNGEMASDFLGQSLPLVGFDQRQPVSQAPSSALTIRIDGGRVVVADDYGATVEAGQRALTRLSEIRRMSQDTTTAPEVMTQAIAEIPGLLATYRRAAERVREVHTKSGMNPYATIDSWGNRFYQNSSTSLEGVMVGFNMQGLNSRDATYQSGTAVKEMIGHFGPVIATEMGIPNVERLGSWGTNAVFAGVPADRAQEFMTRLRQRVVEFLGGNHPFPNEEMARRIGCQRTNDLRIRTWTPELLGMTGGHASAAVPEGARPATVTQRIIETLTLMADRTRFAETHPNDATQGYYAGEVPAGERGRGAEPLLVATRAAESTTPFNVAELVRGGIAEADIAARLLPRPGHDAGYAVAYARALENFFASVGNPPTVEALRARAPELRVITESPQLYLFVQSTRNAQGELNAPAINRVAAPDHAGDLTTLLRSAVNADGTWNWTRISESRSQIVSHMAPPAAAEMHARSASETLNHIYDLSVRDYRFPDFYRPEAFPSAVERFLNGGEGIIQMIDLKNFYSMKMELADTHDTAMRAISDSIQRAYAERGIDVIIAKRGDEFYVCMRARNRVGERVDASTVDAINHDLTTSIRTTFESTVLPQMDKYPGDMAGIHADRIPFSAESLTVTDADGRITEQPGIVIRERPADAVEYVVVGNEVYVTRRPGNMDSFAETVMAASEAGLGRSVDPRNGHLHVVTSFKEVPDTRGQRRTQRYVQLQVNPETGESRPVIVMMPGSEPPRAPDVVRAGIDVGLTISGGMRINEASHGQSDIIHLALDTVGDSTSAQKSPLGPDRLPGSPLGDTIPWEATLSPRGRFGFGAVSFGLPGLGMRVYHDGFGTLANGSTYSGLTRDYLSMSFGSAMAEPAGARVAALLRSRSPMFGHGAGLIGGTVVMSLVSSNGRATFTDTSANIGSAAVGLAGAAAVMRGLRFISGFASLGGPVKAIIKATIETILIEAAGSTVNWGRNQYQGAQLRSTYVTAFRNFDQAVADAHTAGSAATDRDARLRLVRTRSEELGRAFNAYLPFLQMNNTGNGDDYTRAFLRHQSALDDTGQQHRAPLFGATGDSLTFVYSGDANERRDRELADSQAALDSADRRLRTGFDQAVTRASATPPPFIRFDTVQDVSVYRSTISEEPAGLFVQHSNNAMLRLQYLGIPASDMPVYVAAMMGRTDATPTP